ncbi:MAG: HAMP domain-containing sensor histidine kinase [Candidatus Paceibacterota bacterium]
MDSLIFVSILIFGIYLIRSVRREIKQREHIEKLAGELREVNKALFGANEKLKELDKQKTEFVSIASHQLRAPLTAIKGYSSMILEGSFGKVPKKIKEKVDIVFESSQKLVRVIEDFLNITRIELGKMKYELTEFDLKNLTEQVLKEYEATAKNQKIKLSFTADKGEYLVYGDSGKIGQVISNVIDNAIKYTPAGSVKVAVKSGDGKVRIDVTDTGVGLEAEEIEKLFQKFVRADDEGKINVKGTGLGMFVAKQIIEAHQGQIIANSPGKDQGSTFTLELPDAASANREEIKQAGE